MNPTIRIPTPIRLAGALLSNGLLTLAACAPTDVSGPPATDAGPAATVAAAEDQASFDITVIEAVLQPARDLVRRDASGVLALILRPTPDNDGYDLAVLGAVRNPAAETYTSATIRREPGLPADGRTVLTLFDRQAASCRTVYLLGGGAIRAGLGGAITAGPGSFIASFETAARASAATVGVFTNPGPPQVPGALIDIFTNPGPPNLPAVLLDFFQNPGPPNLPGRESGSVLFPPNACVIDVSGTIMAGLG
jgi:hypothetical protein